MHFPLLRNILQAVVSPMRSLENRKGQPTAYGKGSRKGNQTGSLKAVAQAKGRGWWMERGTVIWWEKMWEPFGSETLCTRHNTFRSNRKAPQQLCKEHVGQRIVLTIRSFVDEPFHVGCNNRR